MSLPAFFKKLDKSAQDFFKKKHWNKYNNSFALKSKASGGFALESTLNQADGGKVKASYQAPDKTAQLKKGELTLATAGDWSTKVELNTPVNGLTGSVTGTLYEDCTKNAPHDLKIAGEFQEQQFAGEASLTCSERGQKLSGSSVVSIDNFSVGANLEYAFGKTDSSFSAYDLGFQYSDKDTTVCIKTANKGETVQASVVHTPCKPIQVAAMVTKKKDAAPTLQFGAQKKIDDSTLTKAMIDTDFKFSAFLQHKFAEPNMTVGIASQYNDFGKCFSSGKACDFSALKANVGFTVNIGE